MEMDTIDLVGKFATNDLADLFKTCMSMISQANCEFKDWKIPVIYVDQRPMILLSVLSDTFVKPGVRYKLPNILKSKVRYINPHLGYGLPSEVLPSFLFEIGIDVIRDTAKAATRAFKDECYRLIEEQLNKAQEFHALNRLFDEAIDEILGEGSAEIVRKQKH
jgi:hypothetical protein